VLILVFKFYSVSLLWQLMVLVLVLAI